MKKLIALFLALAMCFGLVACSGASEAPAAEAPAAEAPAAEAPAAEAPAEEKPMRIAHCLHTLAVDYNVMLADKLEKYAAEYGAEVSTASAENDVNTQVTQIENYAAQGFDWIVLWPIDPASCYDAAKAAVESGTKVLWVGQDTVDKDCYTYRFYADEEDMGTVPSQLASDWIDKTFPDAEPGTVEVAVIGVEVNNTYGNRGFVMQDIAEFNDKAKMVYYYDMGMDSTSYATKVPEIIEVILQKHPNINVILSYTEMLGCLADEVLLQHSELDLSKIGQFTVDTGANLFERIELSKENKSTMRGTGAPGLDIALDLVQICMGERDDEAVDKYIMLQTVPIYADNIEEYNYLFE